MITADMTNLSTEQVTQWFAQWQTLEQQIFIAHDARDSKQAKQFMLEAIALFSEFIVTNSQTDAIKLEAQQVYELLPVNGNERLQFICARPAQYACYRQLDELFKETKKKIARLRIQKMR